MLAYVVWIWNHLGIISWEDINKFVSDTNWVRWYCSENGHVLLLIVCSLRKRGRGYKHEELCKILILWQAPPLAEFPEGEDPEHLPTVDSSKVPSSTYFSLCSPRTVQEHPCRDLLCHSLTDWNTRIFSTGFKWSLICWPHVCLHFLNDWCVRYLWLDCPELGCFLHTQLFCVVFFYTSCFCCLYCPELGQKGM